MFSMFQWGVQGINRTYYKFSDKNAADLITQFQELKQK